MARNRGCCALLHLHEDNARFLLLMVVMTLYMLFGATVFMLLEQDKEIEDRNAYQHVLKMFLENNEVNETQLEMLLQVHAEAASAGIIEGKRARWDFAGAFYFVGTVVSTIGKQINVTFICSPVSGNHAMWGNPQLFDLHHHQKPTIGPHTRPFMLFSHQATVSWTILLLPFSCLCFKSK